MMPPKPPLRYVLITPARNEEASIVRTIRSVVNQTVRPARWVIVDDGSTDATASLVSPFLARNAWMELIQLPRHRDRHFAAKVSAFNTGYERVKHLDWDVIGNLDADLSFDPDYCEFLLARFREDPGLGVAGTIFEEEGGYSSARDSFEGHHHVAGGCQLFRRRCFEEIGGYRPNRAGGIDWIAVTSARMLGWKTRSFREKSFFHHRRLGTAGRSTLAAMFSYGEKDYYLGGHPVWELCRVAYRMTRRPYVIAGLAVGLGYCSAFVRRIDRPVPDDLVEFHRAEQMLKLRGILRSLAKLERVDSFTVVPD